MKTLGKLKLKAEKMLSLEELLVFRGGYVGSGGENCSTSCTASGTTFKCVKSGNLDCTCPASGGTSCS